MTLVKTIQKDELTITLSDEGRVLLCAKTVLHWQQLFYSNAADRRIQQEDLFDRVTSVIREYRRAVLLNLIS